MKKNTIINYICEVNYPNSSAYSIHVLKMCDALASDNSKINLIVPNSSVSYLKLKKNYRLKNKINFIKIFNDKKDFNFLLRLLFSLNILKNHISNKENENLIISRSSLFAILAALLNKKIILELHHELSGFTKFLYYSLKKFSLLNNLKYIFIHKNLIKVFNPPKKSFVCLDDGVDIWDFKRKKIVKKIKKTCVYVGSFHSGKGIEIILKIAKKLNNISFHLYGDKKFLSKSKLTKNIKVFNYINYKDIPKTLLKYEIALMPYGNWVSGRIANVNLVNYMSPLKMFDYLASSNIILASDLDVYKHILKHNYNSILVKNSNIDGWIEWINRIFKHKKKFYKVKENAKKTAEKYTWLIRSKKIKKFAKKF